MSIRSRERLTTNISTLDTRVFENISIANPATSLQGTIPGLRVIQITGQSGAKPNIVLRGGHQITRGTASAPLVLVDGVVRDLDNINPAYYQDKHTKLRNLARIQLNTRGQVGDHSRSSH